jgi:hypothetical protein
MLYYIQHSIFLFYLLLAEDPRLCRRDGRSRIAVRRQLRNLMNASLGIGLQKYL